MAGRKMKPGAAAITIFLPAIFLLSCFLANLLRYAIN
jgi:hypothetical protein